MFLPMVSLPVVAADQIVGDDGKNVFGQLPTTTQNNTWLLIAAFVGGLVLIKVLFDD